MDKKLQEHSQTLSFTLGVAFAVLSWADGWHLGLLAVAGIFLVLGLFGDRVVEISSAIFGFKMVARRVAARMLDRTTDDRLTVSDEADAVVVRPTPAQGEGQAFDGTVIAGKLTADAVIAQARAIEMAKTPEELADRVVDYVRSLDETKK